MTELRDAIEDLRLSAIRAAREFERVEVSPPRAKQGILRRLGWATQHVLGILEVLAQPDVKAPVRTVYVEDPQHDTNALAGELVFFRVGEPPIWLPPPGWAPASREKTKRAKGSATVLSGGRREPGGAE